MPNQRGREAFELAAERENENREAAKSDLRFVKLNEHWPERVRQDRERDGRPCLVIPKLPAVIRQVVNDARQNKPAIAVHPVDSGSDPATAEVFNGLIRHIEQSSDAEANPDPVAASAKLKGEYAKIELARGLAFGLAACGVLQWG